MFAQETRRLRARAVVGLLLVSMTGFAASAQAHAGIGHAEAALEHNARAVATMPRPDPTDAATRAGRRTAIIVPGRYVCTVELTWQYGGPNELTVSETESCRYVPTRKPAPARVKILGTALLEGGNP